jgi:hypothetical protein
MEAEILAEIAAHSPTAQIDAHLTSLMVAPARHMTKLKFYC